jgi:flagellar FliL protein
MAKKPKDKQESPPPAAANGEAPRPKGLKALLANKKLLLFAVGGLVVVLAGAGGAAWALGLLKSPPPQQAANDPVAEAAARPRLPHFMDLPEMTVNISSSAQRPQYLRIKLSLELSEAAIAQQIQPILPRVQDSIQTFLREVRPADMDGSGGIVRLKEELTRRINLAAAPARVDAVLFRELLVQ